MATYSLTIVPALLILLWWVIPKRRNRFWTVVAVACWIGAHGAFFIFPEEDIGGNFDAIVLPLAIFATICVGFVCLFPLDGSLKIAGVVIWLITPLTLPASVLVRDMPVNEQYNSCYLRLVGTRIEEYHQQYQRYPDTIDSYILGNDSTLSRSRDIQIECSTLIKTSQHNHKTYNLNLLYQNQAGGYVLGGFYNHFILDFASLTRVCHYNQATKDVACGFNNWAPFAPP